MSPHRDMNRKFPPAPTWVREASWEDELRRSARRRRRVASALKWTGLVLLGAALVGVFGWSLASTYRRQERCEARGGVYLWREGKCVAGVRP